VVESDNATAPGSHRFGDELKEFDSGVSSALKEFDSSIGPGEKEDASGVSSMLAPKGWSAPRSASANRPTASANQPIASANQRIASANQPNAWRVTVM
jgi:hypothetical protein